MKILHICLASFYIDNFSYQENLLPKYHKKLGLDVEIIASLQSFSSNGEICYLQNPSTYMNEHNIKVTRLQYSRTFKSKLFRKYAGTYDAIKEAGPDIIFVHGCQFLDIKEVLKYVNENSDVKVYVDNHADFSNSATNWISKNILHKLIWRHCAQIIEPVTTKFYGVLPARVEFLKKVYKTPTNKTELLVMGADNDKIDFKNRNLISNIIREKYGIEKDDFLIISGGKIDPPKRQILNLMSAVKKIKDPKVKLIVFGSVTLDLKEELNSLIDEHKIQYIGWLNSDEVYDYFLASNLGVFPGRHSVLWEQAVGAGLPCIFKYWNGTTHIDLNGNCDFLYEDTEEEIYIKLKKILKERDYYIRMKKIANIEGPIKFSYEQIAKKSIEI